FALVYLCLPGLNCEMTSQLRGMQPTDSTLRTAPVNPVTTPTLTTFPVSKPDKFTGNPDLCRGFLLQCSVFFDNSPVGSDQAKISFVVSRLSEKALEWATASWPAFNGWTYERFLKEFKLVFDHPYEGKVSGELLTQLRQGPRSVVEYALEFRTLAASSGWNETALLVMFRHGLNPEVLNELASKDDGLSLDQLISLAIKLDPLMNSRRKKGSARGPRNISHPVRVPRDVEIPEPMVCESSRLSEEERQNRFSQQLCFFCGQPGHRIRDCRKRTSQNKA
uniref:CCHC-type domain-containing protein n=1 Tax=Pygocentrus nattereri TaxID=42514 RepID=A0AAR2JVU4_PYGNA